MRQRLVRSIVLAGVALWLVVPAVLWSAGQLGATTTFGTAVDNFSTTLGASHTASSGTFTLASGAGTTLANRLSNAGYPAISSSHPLRFTVISASAFDANGRVSNTNLVATYQATGLSGDVLSGVTAETGSTDQAFAAGSTLAVYISSRSIYELQTAVNTLESGALQAANNLSDVASASTSRTNLGLDTMATQSAGSVAITGGTAVLTQLTAPTIYGSTSNAGNATIRTTTNANKGDLLLADDGGQVAIGTASPQSGYTTSISCGTSNPLYVVGSGSTTYITLDNSAVNSSTGAARNILFKSANAWRWQLGTTGTAETGSNAGSDWVLNAYNDAGSSLGSALTITRATKAAAFGGTISGNGSGLTSLTAANLSGAVAAANGGTGQSSYTLGDLLYASAGTTITKLAGNTTSTRKFLRQTGTGTVSAAPAWDTLVSGDIPDLSSTYVAYGTAPSARATISTSTSGQSGLSVSSTDTAGVSVSTTSGTGVNVASSSGVAIIASSTTNQVLQANQSGSLAADNGQNCALIERTGTLNGHDYTAPLLQVTDSTTAGGDLVRITKNGSTVYRLDSNGHQVASGASATITAGAAAGTSPTVSINGTDAAGDITVTVGTSPPSTGTLFRINFSSTWTTPRSIVLFPKSSNAAPFTTSLYGGGTSTTGISINTTSAFSAGATYNWYYQIR